MVWTGEQSKEVGGNGIEGRTEVSSCYEHFLSRICLPHSGEGSTSRGKDFAANSRDAQCKCSRKLVNTSANVCAPAFLVPSAFFMCIGVLMYGKSASIERDQDAC